MKTNPLMAILLTLPDAHASDVVGRAENGRKRARDDEKGARQRATLLSTAACSLLLGARRETGDGRVMTSKGPPSLPRVRAAEAVAVAAPIHPCLVRQNHFIFPFIIIIIIIIILWPACTDPVARGDRRATVAHYPPSQASASPFRPLLPTTSPSTTSTPASRSHGPPIDTSASTSTHIHIPIPIHIPSPASSNEFSPAPRATGRWLHALRILAAGHHHHISYSSVCRRTVHPSTHHPSLHSLRACLLAIAGSQPRPPPPDRPRRNTRPGRRPRLPRSQTRPNQSQSKHQRHAHPSLRQLPFTSPPSPSPISHLYPSLALRRFMVALSLRPRRHALQHASEIPLAAVAGHPSPRHPRRKGGCTPLTAFCLCGRRGAEPSPPSPLEEDQALPR